MDRIVEAFRTQARWCEELGSPFTAGLLECLAERLPERQSWPGDVLRDWQGDPVADLLPLRLAGAIHAIVLSGEAPALASVFPPDTMQFDAARSWPLIDDALHAHRALIDAYLALPPQTNEVGRAAVLLGGFLEVARRFAQPLRLLEIGASAGLNQVWDRFRYRLGDSPDSPSWGDSASPVTLSPHWEGPSPPLDAPIRIAHRAACDQSPIDINDPKQLLQLRSYVWPDQRDRLARLDAAVALARTARVQVEQANADDWLARQLADPVDGSCTVLFHSIVWTYVEDSARKRIHELIEQSGSARSARVPLAWLRFEFVEKGKPPRLLLDTWPGERQQELAHAHPHGTWVRWLSR